ncbi:MAG: hypothetical protein LLF99_18975 [Desulfobacteraceae bacterium]|nr:hypothetical protein [Desulfobacteraceae bacterium]
MSGRAMVKRCIFIIMTVMSASWGWAAEKPQAPVSVAVLPFGMHAPPDLAYLQDGIRDMLSSRLAAQDKVQVVDRNSVSQAMKGSKGDVSPEDAKRIAKILKADYVLFGSLTALGQSVSIDAKMVPVSGNGEPVALYTQTKSMDEVIPQVNRFAQEINQKVFKRTDAGGKTADAESDSTRNPEFLVAGMLQNKDNISYLNPNFVELTNEASLRQTGVWRSQEMEGSVMGMDIGDVDGDGKNEVVICTADKVMVYRKEHNGLKVLGNFNGSKTDHFLWVSVVDVNRDKKSRIFVTNLKKFNAIGGATTETIKGTRGFTEGLASFALEIINGKLQQVGSAVPYYLNGVTLPKRGKVLIGQKKGEASEEPFLPGITEMQMVGGNITTSTPVNVPSKCNVFNFAAVDINNDHADEYAVIDSQNRLAVINAGGDTIWKSDKLFATTTNQFEGKVTDRRYNDVDVYFMPSSMEVTDLNGDGIQEIVVTRNVDNATRFLPDTMKYFDKGEVLSLSWDNMGMVENWKTREISGMVTCLRVADLSNEGKKQLVLSVVSAKDLLKLTKAKSVIVSYDLNIHGSKAGAK